MKLEHIKRTWIVIPILLAFMSCEKESAFDFNSAMEVRIKSSTNVTVQVGGNISMQLPASNDTLSNHVDFLLAPGTEILFLRSGNGEVIINLDTLRLQEGVTASYVISETTRVPDGRICEVWPELRECVPEAEPEEGAPDNG